MRAIRGQGPLLHGIQFCELCDLNPDNPLQRRSGSACVVWASAHYNHGVPLAGVARHVGLNPEVSPQSCSTG